MLNELRNKVFWYSHLNDDRTMNIYKFKNYPGAEQGSLASISSIPLLFR